MANQPMSISFGEVDEVGGGQLGSIQFEFYRVCFFTVETMIYINFRAMTMICCGVPTFGTYIHFLLYNSYNIFLLLTTMREHSFFCAFVRGTKAVLKLKARICPISKIETSFAQALTGFIFNFFTTFATTKV